VSGDDFGTACEDVSSHTVTADATFPHCRQRHQQDSHAQTNDT